MKIIISYGDGCRSGVMWCIGITRQNKGKARNCIGMAFVKCVLDEKYNNFYIQNMEVTQVESRMERYCLLLPLIDKGNFDNEFAIVYNDWDVGDENFGKVLPNLCSLCFETDVFG